MSHFMPHLAVERDELALKKKRLEDFIETNDIFARLSPETKGLLIEQHQVMARYLAILDRRALLFKAGR